MVAKVAKKTLAGIARSVIDEYYASQGRSLVKLAEIVELAVLRGMKEAAVVASEHQCESGCRDCKEMIGYDILTRHSNKRNSRDLYSAGGIGGAGGAQTSSAAPVATLVPGAPE